MDIFSDLLGDLESKGNVGASGISRRPRHLLSRDKRGRGRLFVLSHSYLKSRICEKGIHFTIGTFMVNITCFGCFVMPQPNVRSLYISHANLQTSRVSMFFFTGTERDALDLLIRHAARAFLVVNEEHFTEFTRKQDGEERFYSV